MAAIGTKTFEQLRCDSYGLALEIIEDLQKRTDPLTTALALRVCLAVVIDRESEALDRLDEVSDRLIPEVLAAADGRLEFH